MDDREVFRYTYSAKEQQEIRAICQKYRVPTAQQSALDRLRALDKRVTAKAMTPALIVGIFGTLVMGFGMSLAMSELGLMLGAYAYLAMPVGILIGVAGMVLMAVAYPIYSHVLRRARKKAAPEILRLTEELSNQITN